MIGKPEWFTYRIFGWGLRPKTWQGWAYVCLAALLIGFTTAVTLNTAFKAWIFGLVFGLIILDMIHIMTQLEKVHDERDNYHQLIIERNCSFAAIASLVGIALYQAYQHRALINTGALPFDYSLIIVLGAMAVVKAISYAYVKYKM